MPFYPGTSGSGPTLQGIAQGQRIEGAISKEEKDRRRMMQLQIAQLILSGIGTIGGLAGLGRGGGGGSGAGGNPLAGGAATSRYYY